VILLIWLGAATACVNRRLLRALIEKADAPDFPVLLGERAEWRHERARSKRKDQVATIVHAPSPEFVVIMTNFRLES
jgi:hypothetical protein